MSFILDKLHSQLLTSGLQNQNPPLYQVINQLIGELKKVEAEIDIITPSNGPSSIVIINPSNYPNSFSNTQGEDGIDGIPGPRGIQGLVGPQGYTIIGNDGEDGIDGIPNNRIITNFTLGSVIFAGPSGNLAQNNARFFWDNTNFRLGIGLATPDRTLTLLSTGILGWDNASGVSDILLSRGGVGLLDLKASGTNHAELRWFRSDQGTLCGRIYSDSGENCTVQAVNSDLILETASAGSGITYRVAGTNVFRATIRNVTLLSAGQPTTGTGGIIFPDGTALATLANNTAALYADDVAGTVRMFGIDEAGVTGALVMASAPLTSGVIPITGTNGLLKDSTPALLVAGSVPVIAAFTFEKAETGTDANILTYTSGAADEFLVVQVAADISAITGTSVVVTITWKDSNNATATSTLTLSAVGDGTLNIPMNVKSSTNVVVSSVFVGVSTAYNVSAFITRLK